MMPALRSSRRVLLALLPLLTLGCSTVDRAPRPQLDTAARWAVLPLANHTETPGAGQRAATVVEGVLRARGLTDLQRAPGPLGAESLFEPADAQTLDKALAWARGAGMRYAVTGSVTEWRYKVGVDGEPAVGLGLQVIDLTTGRTAWAATGARSGWSREALSAVAQKLVRDLTEPLAR
jgi:polysaccharide biosynthesis protein PelC